jgi:FixJ family two-component response regulator
MDLQAELATSERQLPIVFVTGHGDIPMTVRAMRAGAIEFLTKPYRRADLLKAIALAIERDCAGHQRRREADAVRVHYGRLTARERQVMALVVAGWLNKQIAGELGTTERTVKFHRAHVMTKMEAASVADLVRMAGRLDAPPAPAARPVPRDS